MEKSWNIVYYQSPDQDRSPVYDFINSFDAKTISKIYHTLNLLETYGTQLGSPHFKKLVGEKLWEIRLLGQNNIRIFYVAVQKHSFLLVHGFEKKKQKTDRKEIVLALSRVKEYYSRQ
jgi:phage-related protein